MIAIRNGATSTLTCNKPVFYRIYGREGRLCLHHRPGDDTNVEIECPLREMMYPCIRVLNLKDTLGLRLR